VFAITCWYWNLRVPGAAEQKDAGSALQAQWPAYLSYLATFLTVALIWINHHVLFIRIRYVDQQLQWMNIAILLGVCVTPFPNALVADALRTGLSCEAAKTATAAYGFVFMMTTLCLDLDLGDASPVDRNCCVLPTQRPALVGSASVAPSGPRSTPVASGSPGSHRCPPWAYSSRWRSSTQ
jgi:hypothetical protein